MTEDPSNRQEKSEFTLEGEALGYIGLDQARVRAIEEARDNTDFYGPSYAGVRLVWEVLSTEESDDYYDIRLSFRPSGRYRGEPGVELFIYDKTGGLRVRQILDEPTALGETVDSATPGPAVAAAHPDEPRSRPTPTTSPMPTPTATPSVKPSPAPELSPPSALEFLLKWGSQGSGDGQFKLPSGIAVDEAGNVYVADRGNHRVQVFDSNGRFPRKWGKGSGIGRFMHKWGSEGRGDGQFNGPSGISVDGTGNVYVADLANHRVQVFDSGGRFLGKWGSWGHDTGKFEDPCGIAVDGAGNVYVADSPRHRVQIFDGNGRFLAQCVMWSDTQQLSTCTDVAVDGAGNVYVVDRGRHQVQVFDINGRLLGRRGSAGYGDAQFNLPYGIAVDGAGNVYVTDRGSHRVQVFDAKGLFLSKWGSGGTGNGQFQNPEGVTVDGAGNVYVVDQGHHRVQVFAPVR